MSPLAGRARRPRRGPKIWLTAVSLAALLLPAAPAAAQEPQEAAAPAEAFVDRITVTAVELMIDVRDDQGLAVLGLEADDFEVLEDGKPMKVLGLETSCDETAAAVVADGVAVRSSVVAAAGFALGPVRVVPDERAEIAAALGDVAKDEVLVLTLTGNLREELGGPDRHRLVGLRHVERATVGLGMHRHRRHPHLPAHGRASDRDLAEPGGHRPDPSAYGSAGGRLAGPAGHPDRRAAEKTQGRRDLVSGRQPG